MEIDPELKEILGEAFNAGMNYQDAFFNRNKYSFESWLKKNEAKISVLGKRARL